MWRNSKEKDYIVVSIFDTSTNNEIGWSSKISIDKVSDFAIKVRKNKNSI